MHVYVVCVRVYVVELRVHHAQCMRMRTKYVLWTSLGPGAWNQPELLFESTEMLNSSSFAHCWALHYSNPLMAELKAIVTMPRGDPLAPFDVVSILWPSVDTTHANRIQYREFLRYFGYSLRDFHLYPGSFALHNSHVFLKLISQLQAVSKLDRGEADEIVSRVAGQPFSGNVDSGLDKSLFRSLESALSIWSHVSIQIS